jgi:hypothetical protein
MPPSTIRPRNESRQNAPAHPSNVSSACETSSSWRGAEAPITVESAIRSALQASTIESTVRLFRRPASNAVRIATFHGRPRGATDPS